MFDEHYPNRQFSNEGQRNNFGVALLLLLLLLPLLFEYLSTMQNFRYANITVKICFCYQC